MDSSLSNEEQQYLLHLYTTISLPSAYSSPRQLYNEVKKAGKYNLTYNQICEWLKDQKGYYFHKQIRRPKKYVPIFSPYPGYMLEGDLLSYVTLKKYNKNRQYLFALIDQASRKVFGRAIGAKTGDNIVSALKSIFSSNKFFPKKIKFDLGSEFVNTTVKSYLKSKNIQLVFGTNPSVGKNPLIERFFLSFRLKTARLMTHRNTRVWYRYVGQILKSYNSSPHRGINNLTPNEAFVMKPADLFIKIYRDYKDDKKDVNENKPKNKPRKQSNKFKFQITDYVRVALEKDKFYKVFKPSFSTEVYGIRKRERKNNIELYFLHDLSPKKEDILGSWMTYELQKAEPFLDKWEIEKVLKVFTQNDVKYAHVRWKGFDQNHNSIILYSDIQ